MSLHSLPTFERAWATLVVLALATALGLGLALVWARELRSSPPLAATLGHSRLLASLEGVMAANVSPAEVERFRTWVAGGATGEGFVPVEAVVANNCASCHGPGGQYPRITSFEDLRPLALEAAPTGLLGLVDPRSVHLIAFPLICLVAIVGFLRRTGLPRRRLLMGACAMAVLFDAGQWWLRQGRPEHLWAAWVGATALAAAMAVLAMVVLWELWGPKAR